MNTTATGQDRLYLKTGTTRTVTVISVEGDHVYYREAGRNGVLKMSTEQLLMVEQSGKTHVFKTATQQNTLALTGRRNFVGAQPFELMTGRATLVYERLLPSERVGIVVPLSLTYFPKFMPLATVMDSSSFVGISGVSFIGGIDVNFYVGKNTRSRFFLGPRVRYGVDMFLERIQGYTVQTQLGWRFGADDAAVLHHLCMGFGFARIVSSAYGPFPYPERSFGWFSGTYRISFRW